MRAIEAVTAKGETSALCQSIGVSRASSPRALVPAERRAVRDTLGASAINCCYPALISF